MKIKASKAKQIEGKEDRSLTTLEEEWKETKKIRARRVFRSRKRNYDKPKTLLE